MKSVMVFRIESDHTKDMYDAMILDLYKKGRAKVDIIQNENILEFRIASSDFTSVRATINSVLLKLRMFSELDAKLAKLNN